MRLFIVLLIVLLLINAVVASRKNKKKDKAKAPKQGGKRRDKCVLHVGPPPPGSLSETHVSCRTSTFFGFMKELRYETSLGGRGLNLITEDVSKVCVWCEKKDKKKKKKKCKSGKRKCF
ncbi:uncharacterized protein LOC134817518 [Bolinopsis microptera]|uniref:uncharacterized protein LOC134817518 n=1 Tax=Bolinopsis microptera TaxID=2820187 RepID=UPI003078B393